MKKPYSAFTLVELIVVIVILAILATIAFLSFNNYSSSARDSVRLSDITSIAKGLVVQYSIGGYYILPDNNVSLLSGSTLIGYQGKAGSNVLSIIKISSNSGKDPIDNTYYTYNTNINKNKYQLSGFLESKGSVINRIGSINNGTLLSSSFGAKGNRVEESINKIKYFLNTRKIPGSSPRMTDILIDISTTLRSAQYDDNDDFVAKTNATTYTNRYPYTKGDSIGVILSSTGGTGSIIYTPLEDSGTGIDISSGTQVNGKIVISNNVDSSVGVSVGSMSGYVSGGSSSSNSQIDSNTVLLLHGDGSEGSLTFTDSATTKSVTKNGTVQISASQSKFGGASINFNGANGNYLRIASNLDFAFGTNDFTIDGWFYRSAINPSNYSYIFDFRDSGPTELKPTLYINDSTNKLDYYTNGSIRITQSNTLSLNTWYHFAVVRYGTTTTLYINGSNVGFWTDTINYTQGQFTLSNYPVTTNYNLNGYFDEIRISKGIARWITPSFVVPNTPY